MTRISLEEGLELYLICDVSNLFLNGTPKSLPFSLQSWMC